MGRHGVTSRYTHAAAWLRYIENMLIRVKGVYKIEKQGRVVCNDVFLFFIGLNLLIQKRSTAIILWMKTCEFLIGANHHSCFSLPVRQGRHVWDATRWNAKKLTLLDVVGRVKLEPDATASKVKTLVTLSGLLQQYTILS